MTHFHVLSTKGLRVSIAALTFDTYEDSIVTYVNLASQFFTHFMGSESLCLENAVKATHGGEGAGALCGTDELAFVWMRCEEGCTSATWN